MAQTDFRNDIEAAEEASLWARVTADTVNLAAWGENNANSAPQWVSLHAHTVDVLCTHIDQLVTRLRQGGPL